ncbi:MAG: M18 family aminopeptidase, partial [Bacteroidaceae bacterium]|nr:M18 family aminopeptidase [Bacteroidaceae bacterium]
MIQRLIDFLNASPVNFLAVQTLAHLLESNGFQKIDATQTMADLQPGDQVYVTKNDSSLFAFRIGSGPLSENGFHIICAHSDSPTFR